MMKKSSNLKQVYICTCPFFAIFVSELGLWIFANNLHGIKRAVAKLEVSGRKAKAAKMIEEAIESAEKEGKLHEAYEFEMLYTEMLIYMVINYLFN